MARSGSGRPRMMPLWAVPLLLFMAIGTVWLRHTIVNTTYAINKTERKIRDLQQEREQVYLKVTALRSPRRLETLAKSKFGLTQPKSEQVIHVSQ